ncbi:MAG: FAD-dependent oxidoreductase [Micrococcales bacterium]|nr:FAD-dependent oxidoreductase [Micrococcales bacterium]
MGTTVFERYPPAESVVEHALAETRQSVFWIDDLPHRHPRRKLVGDVSVDLAIVGGGLLGLWTAVLAKHRDPSRSVALVEARRIGWAASGRNGGFVDASLTHGEANGRARWPEEYSTLERLGRANLAAMERDVEELGLACEWERTGELDVATEPHQLDWLEGEPRRADGSWPDAVLLDAAGVQAEVASPSYLGATWRRRDVALLNPGRLCAELARVAENLGVQLYEQSPARSLLDSGAGLEVITESGRIRTQHVALATGVYPPLLRRTRLLTVPVYDYVLATEPLSPPQLEQVGWRNRQGIGDLANQFHYYRLTADDRIVFGGYDAVYHYGGRIRSSYENRPQSFRTLARHFFTTFPQLEGLRFTHRWAGVIDTSTRFSAFFGTAREGRVAYAAGFTGLGLGVSRFAGETVLDLLDGEPTERTQLRMVRERPLPFPPEPAAWAGIQATRAALNRADHDGGRRGPLLRTLDAAGLGFDS